MNHKEEMEYLKEHNPILYYELTQDQMSGTDNALGGCLMLLFLLAVFLVIAALVFFLF